MRRTRSLHLLSVVLLGVVLITSAACSSDSEGSGGDGPTDGLPEVPASKFEDLTGKAEVTVEASDNVFTPRYITVSPGTEITFENVGIVPHNVMPAEEGAFEEIPTDDLAPDESATLVIDEPGTYPYYCSLHGTAKRGMNGRIVVKG